MAKTEKEHGNGVIAHYYVDNEVQSLPIKSPWLCFYYDRISVMAFRFSKKLFIDVFVTVKHFVGLVGHAFYL